MPNGTKMAAVAVVHPPKGPVFSIVLVLHILAAAVGYGAMILTGVQAERVRRGPRAPGAESARAFFRPGTNWAARAVYLVPVLGVVLVALSRGAFGFGDTFVDVGIAVWAASVAVAESVLWPAEREVQRLLRDGWPIGDQRALASTCRRISQISVALGIAFVGVGTVMAVKP